MWQALLQSLTGGNTSALARSISLVENEYAGYLNFLESLPPGKGGKIIGVTGPPGAGKSTLVNGLITELVGQHYKVGVLCVDPSSPFNLGAVLGDRIRMSSWYLHPQVFIRSLATRGSIGGLHPKIIEITELLKAAAFDYIVVETVGVGQSEIEIAGLADTTVVVLVPEGGDEVQTMKAGLMEIADIFVVNKSDRPGADALVRALQLMLSGAFRNRKEEVPIIKTVAQEGTGLKQLVANIQLLQDNMQVNDKRTWLLVEKAWQMIQQRRMTDISRVKLKTAIEKESGDGFHLFRFINSFLKSGSC